MKLKTTKEYEKISKNLNFQTKAFINGEFTNSISGNKFETINPSNGEIITEVAECDEKDVDIAVEAARKSFNSRVWSGIEPSERKEIMLKWADLVEEHHEELAVMETLDNGKTIRDTFTEDIPDTISCIRFHAEAIDKIQDDMIPSSDNGLNMVVREPIGVVAAIIPWNFPLLMGIWKIAPILAAGNSLIAKPAKLTSLTLLKLVELAKEAGIPDGVFNVVPGAGSVVGSALARHNDVRLITFTGSTKVGKHLLVDAGETNAKRVLLEMGGKSPTIVMPDIKDLDYVAESIVLSALFNAGQNCTQNSRIYIHKDIKPELTDLIIDKVNVHKVGNPFDPDTTIGALIEEEHLKKVKNYIKIGKEEGGKIICGGNQALEDSGGYFVEPTLFDDVEHNMTIAKEEIFGPVFALLEFEELNEVIEMANDTKYGLQASVYTSDLDTANKLARGIQAGVVSVNHYSEGDENVPFGGFKESGFFARDKSVWANRSYTEIKSICVQFN